MTAPVLSVPIQLTIPLPIMKDGNAATVSSLTLSRPKTRHVKNLALLVGGDLLAALMRSNEATPSGKVISPDGADQLADETSDVDVRALVSEVAPLLFSETRLDAFQRLLGDLLSISEHEVGEIDPADLLTVFKGFVGFFPALQSIGSRNSPQT